MQCRGRPHRPLRRATASVAVLVFLVVAAAGQLPDTPVAPPLVAEVALEPYGASLQVGENATVPVLVRVSCPAPSVYPDPVTLGFHVVGAPEGLAVAVSPESGSVSFGPSECLDAPQEREIDVVVELTPSLLVPAAQPLSLEFLVRDGQDVLASHEWTEAVGLHGKLGVSFADVPLRPDPDVDGLLFVQGELRNEANVALSVRFALDRSPQHGSVTVPDPGPTIPQGATVPFAVIVEAHGERVIHFTLAVEASAEEGVAWTLGPYLFNLSVDPRGGTVATGASPPAPDLFWPLVVGVPLIVIAVLFLVGLAIARARETAERGGRPPT